MRLEKAYEYFSAYYEGSLDAAMRAQLDRMFEAHSVLRKDFDSFANAMEDLDRAFADEAPIPHDLHDRITTRIDHAAFEQERAKPTGLLGLWRRFALGGLAVVLLGGAAIGILNRGPLGQTSANLGASVDLTRSSADLRVEADKHGAYLRFHPGSQDTVQIRRLPDGKVLESYQVSQSRVLDVPLKNTAAEPVILQVSTSKSDRAIIVIIPGSEASEKWEGEGKVLDLAIAMSKGFSRPVTLDTKATNEIVRWEFNQEDVTRSTVAPGELTVELKDQLIRIRY